MKKSIFLTALTLLVSTAAMSQREEPRYAGATASVADGETCYLLNTSANLFYTYGNDWGTHATLGAEGIPVIFQATGETNDDGREVYELRNFLPSKNAWYYSFLTTNDYDAADATAYHWYTDGSVDKPDHFFCLEPVEGNTFRLYASETNAEVSHSGDFADYYLTFDPEYYDGKNLEQTGTGVVYASASELPQNVWAAVAEEDYTAYIQAREVYQAAQRLQALIEEARELGIDDLEAAEAAYANLALTTEELETAISDLMQLFTRFYEENVTPASPIYMTRYLLNPGFDGSLEGWTNGVGADMFELGTWTDMIDGTAYTGTNYLNIWNGSGVQGNISQTVEGLPNGVYGVTIAAHSDAEGGYIFAGGVQTAVVKGYVDKAAGKYGQDYSVVTLVTDGTLELGYHSEHDGQFWSTMDNARLMYYGAGEDAYQAWVEKSVEQAPSFDGARCQPALIEAYNAALKALEEADLDEHLMTFVNDYLEALNAVNANIKAYNELEAEILNDAEVIPTLTFQVYQTQAQNYIDEVAQPALEAHQLGTDEVVAIREALGAIIWEGQQSLALFEELMALNDYLGKCITEYETSAAEEAVATAKALYDEVSDVITNAETDIENNDQIRALKQRIEEAVYALRIPVGEASDDNPMDYTVYVTNPDFEDGLTGWTNENGPITTFEVAGSWSDGVYEMARFLDHTEKASSYYLNLWDAAPNGYRVLQTLTDLPNGTYTVAVTAYANAANAAFVFANGSSVMVEAADALPGNAHRYEVTTKVTDGTLTIGVILHRPDGEIWATFDDFTLTAYGPNSVREITGDAFAEFAPDAIAAPRDAAASDIVIYNLAGQRVQTLRKGIHIVGGRKVYVK